MRYLSLGLGVATLLAFAGCHNFPSRGTGQPQAAAQLPAKTPDATALVAYLNDNASRIQSIDCRELDLSCRQRLQRVGMHGWMVCQKPRNFRMGANLLGKQAVDMGSNDREFWFWISKNDPPDLFFCNYSDLETGRARMPFPFQPEWIMEALGMASYGPAEKYQVRATKDTLELIEQTRSPQGAPVSKITVFSRVPARGTQPQVTAHILQDARGQVICAANVTEVQIDQRTGAVVPRKVSLTCPAEHVELNLKLDDTAVNGPIEGQRQAQLFARPVLKGVATRDLAQLQGPGAIQQTGGFRR